MTFYDRFELLELVRDEGAKTFRAREIATGRTVEAHLFVNPHAPLTAALMKRLDQLPDGERSRIVDQGLHDGIPYLVTVPLTEFAGLREWISAVRHAGAGSMPPLGKAGAWEVPTKTTEIALQQPSQILPPPEAALAPTAQVPAHPGNPPNGPSGEFTAMFAAPTGGGPTPAAPEMGAFTRMFQAGSTPAGTPKPAGAPPAPGPSASGPPAGAGAFTRMFQNNAPPAATPKPPAPTSGPTAAASPSPASGPPSGAGEFTRMFQAARPPASGQNQAPPQPALPPTMQPPAQPAGNRPGEFTQMLQASKPSQGPSRQAAPDSSGSQPGEFTRMFQARPGSPPSQNPATVQMPPGSGPSGSPPSGSSGPGEFTRMLQTPSRPGGAPPQPGPPYQNSPAGPGEFTRFFEAPVGPMPQSPILQGPLRPQAPGSQGPNRVGDFTQVFGKADIPQPPPATAPSFGTPVGATNATQTFQAPPFGQGPQGQGGYPLPGQNPGGAGSPYPQPPQGLQPGQQLPLGQSSPAAGQGNPQGFMPIPGVIPMGSVPAASPDFTQPAGFGQMGGFAQPPNAVPSPNMGGFQGGGGQLPGAPGAPHSPGEFTQKFSAPAALTLGQAPAAGAKLPVAPPGKNRLPLFVAIGGGVLVIILLIVFLVTRK